MTVEQEEKILKAMPIFVSPVLIFANLGAKNHILLLCMFCVSVLLGVLTGVLAYRKYGRDKKEGKDVKRYKMALIFIGLSLLICIGFIFYL